MTCTQQFLNFVHQPHFYSCLIFLQPNDSFFQFTKHQIVGNRMVRTFHLINKTKSHLYVYVKTCDLS